MAFQEKVEAGLSVVKKNGSNKCLSVVKKIDSNPFG